MCKDKFVIEKAKENIIEAKLSDKCLTRLSEILALEWVLKELQIRHMTAAELKEIYVWVLEQSKKGGDNE